MAEKCDKLRKSLLVKTDATPTQLLLMWDHASAIRYKDTNIQIVDLTSASSASHAGLSVPHPTDASMSQNSDVYELPSLVVAPVPDPETRPNQFLSYPENTCILA
jgi:hypothetical protein